MVRTLRSLGCLCVVVVCAVSLTAQQVHPGQLNNPGMCA